MADETTTQTTDTTQQPVQPAQVGEVKSTQGAEVKPQADEKPKPPDVKEELNAVIRKAGLKLKARDKEVPVTSIDDLLSRAQRVYGVEALLEEAKAAKSEVEAVKSWLAAVESDDARAAEEAFEALSPKAQRNALAWLQRKMEAAKEEESMTQRERELRAALEASERQRREYERRDAEARRQREEAEARAELERQRNIAAGIAQKTLEALKAPKELAPALVPRVARVLRVGLEAGIDLTPDEVAAEVRDEVLGEVRLLTASLDGEALIAALGEETAKKLAKAFLARRRQTPPTQAQVQAATQQAPKSNGVEDKLEKLRGTPAFWRY
jgi:hypothetical protein